MPLTQEQRFRCNYTNNNDDNYLHKKFKKIASTIAVVPSLKTSNVETHYVNSEPSQSASASLIPNGSISAAHPEIEKIKDREDIIQTERNVQTNFNQNTRLSFVNYDQLSGQTSYSEEFPYKTENLENNFTKDTQNGSIGRYVCPYCKLSCAKPSVLQKHIRAHTNERPYPCIPCGFAFKTKSNLYKHRRSRTHALRSQGSDITITANDDEWSASSESDTSSPPTSASDPGFDVNLYRVENYRPSELSSPEPGIDRVTPPIANSDATKMKPIYKPKFRAALYQSHDEKEKNKKSFSPSALNEHISKIISDNEAIVDVIETPLQKKYRKIKQIAQNKKLYINDNLETKSDSTPLNLTKGNGDYENDSTFRKRSHSESFSQTDHKHPLNPEGSIIKDLLLKTKAANGGTLSDDAFDSIGPLYVCPLCKISYRSADNLEIHRTYYCKGNSSNTISTNTLNKSTKIRPENVYMRSNSVNVKLTEGNSNPDTKTSPRNHKPDNLIIFKPEHNEVIPPLPSPGPLLGNTRLVDTKATSDHSRRSDSLKSKTAQSPKRKIDSRSDSFSPRLVESTSPRLMDLYPQSKIRCIEGGAAPLKHLEDFSQLNSRQNPTTSLQMFGGEVKIVDLSGSTTTLRIEPSKNQLSPIVIPRNLSPSKIVNEAEASSVVVRSGLHSGGTIVHNPLTPKEVVTTPQTQTPRITISTPSGQHSNLPNIQNIPHFQFPPLSAITAFNPLTLPPLSPSLSPKGTSTVLHGGKLIPHVPGIPGPNTPGLFVGNANSQLKSTSNKNVLKSNIDIPQEGYMVAKEINVLKFDSTLNNIRTSTSRAYENEKNIPNTPRNVYDNEVAYHVSSVPIIKIKDADETNEEIVKVQRVLQGRHDLPLKRSIDGLIRPPANFNPTKNSMNNNFTSTTKSSVQEKLSHFNFENLITKAEIFNNLIPSSSEVQKNTTIPENLQSCISGNDRSETFYFKKNSVVKCGSDDRKPKFLRPSTLPLKPGTFTPKKHHGITPNANTMPLVSPETPRPSKAYGQLYLNGNAYTYLGLKCSTKVFYCTINRPQPTYVPNQHFLSMYSNWQLLSELTPDPLGLNSTSAMSLYDSRHRPQNICVSAIKQDLILTHSSQWNKYIKENKQNSSLDIKKSEDVKLQCDANYAPKKELTGGFESNEEYTYVRGRGRGRYVCSECGIRCKKPSMLKKHIRTHTDVRPYTCTHCAFSFKTKGNLTKHMKSKAHYKKCSELGISPHEGAEVEVGDMTQISGETDEESDSEGDEGNEGETESSDTETCKSRLPEHEAAHCLLSLGSSRPTTSGTPGLITSARPTTYPYTPTGSENSTKENVSCNLIDNANSRNVQSDSKIDVDNEPMDLSRTDVKTINSMTEIPTARESSVLASLASNTAKLPLHQTQWSNGEPMLHAYLTERALLDSKIKQSQLTTNLSKIRKTENDKQELLGKNNTITTTMSKIKSNSSNAIMEIKTTPLQVLNATSDIKQSLKENEHVVFKIARPKESISDVSTLPLNNYNNTPNEESESKKNRISAPEVNSSKEIAKFVVSEYLKLAKVNATNENNINDNTNDSKGNNEEGNRHCNENTTDTDSIKLPMIDHDPIARKVVIGAGGIAFKVASKGKEFDGAPTYPTGRLMEDGRRVCDFCNKTFTKPSQLRLHLNIHYMERPFRCSACAVSFRTRGHLQKHERSGSHHNKVSMTSTFGAATSLNPRPFRCSDCNIAFRIHGHLAKHLRSKMHVMRLECLFKLPFGTFTEIERAGVSLTDIDTTDCASSLSSLQLLAQKLHEKDPTKLEYRDKSAATAAMIQSKDSSDEEDCGLIVEKVSETEKDSEMRTTTNSESTNDKSYV